MIVLCSGIKKEHISDAFIGCYECIHSSPHEESENCNRVCGKDNSSFCCHSYYVISMRKEKLNRIEDESRG